LGIWSLQTNAYAVVACIDNASAPWLARRDDRHFIAFAQTQSSRSMARVVTIQFYYGTLTPGAINEEAN
jgi:hypothetical protein